MKTIRFFKMEGAGNDYVYVDARQTRVDPVSVVPSVLPALCDRRYGVGADGLVIIAPSARADARMWMWNADGSSSDMCGNALRCVALYVSSTLEKRERVLIESGAGAHAAEILSLTEGPSGLVRLDMAAPTFAPERIPYLGKIAPGQFAARFHVNSANFAGEPLSEDGYVVSMGNPHCVFFVSDPDAVDLERIGPQLEHHRDFPARTNVEFVAVREDGTLYQRTWERGSGETLACGSGACAALVASAVAGKGPRKNTVHLRGGDLGIEWTDSTVWMTGPARFVFSGELDASVFPLFGR